MTAPSVTVHRIGREQEPVVVIEHFAPDPDALRTAARTAAFEPAGEHYPGIRAALPPGYVPAVRACLSNVFREVFGSNEAASVIDLCWSMVTMAPDALSIEQRLPHIDALEPGRLALVHFLGSGEEDGTAFYRHRSTGFETIDQRRSAAYFAALNTDVKHHGAPPLAYPTGDTPIFERIARFDGLPNRALVYRGRLLHSGDITPGRMLPTDPATGRLTVTGFFAAR